MVTPRFFLRESQRTFSGEQTVLILQLPPSWQIFERALPLSSAETVRTPLVISLGNTLKEGRGLKAGEILYATPRGDISPKIFLLARP